MKSRWQRPEGQFLGALFGASLASIGLFLVSAYRNRSLEFSYFIWNLFLAWVSLVFAIWLVRTLRHKVWSSWEAMAASLLWLMFLPNSFYMVTDFIHLQDVTRVDLVYDAVMFTSFIFVSVIIGLCSLYLVHREFNKRFTWNISALWLGVVMLLCSFAIYLGRDLRWNSWDVFTNPGGLLFDISDRLLHPGAYPSMLLTVFVFFVLIATMYSLVWRGIALVRASSRPPRVAK